MRVLAVRESREPGSLNGARSAPLKRLFLGSRDRWRECGPWSMPPCLTESSDRKCFSVNPGFLVHRVYINQSLQLNEMFFSKSLSPTLLNFPEPSRGFFLNRRFLHVRYRPRHFSPAVIAPKSPSTKMSSKPTSFSKVLRGSRRFSCPPSNKPTRKCKGQAQPCGSI